tara:strand:- start:5879 stop:6043 length:165 start_codon:yes stop_codon:yes gene_type:complete
MGTTSDERRFQLCCDNMWNTEHVLRCLICGKPLPKTVKTERDFPNFAKYKDMTK